VKVSAPALAKWLSWSKADQVREWWRKIAEEGLLENYCLSPTGADGLFCRHEKGKLNRGNLGSRSNRGNLCSAFIERAPAVTLSSLNHTDRAIVSLEPTAN
jgi:hypothetical protein